MKEFEDENVQFDENGRKFSKRVENTVFSKDLKCRNVKTRLGTLMYLAQGLAHVNPARMEPCALGHMS